MTRKVAPGYGQDPAETDQKTGEGEKGKKPRRPDSDTGLDGQCHEFGGRLRTKHTSCGKPARSAARGPVAMY